MNTVDKIVTEWAFRCKKGYPDTSNPQDMRILKEIYSEYGIVLEEEKPTQQPSKTIQDVVDLLAAKQEELSPEQIEKLFNVVNKTGKGYTTTLMDKLQQKQLGDEQALLVVGYADKNHFEDKMAASIDNKANTFNALGTSGNLLTKLTELSGIESKYVSKLIGFTTGAGQKSVGKGEIALVSLLHDTKSAKKGDVEVVGGPHVELKGVNAILANSKHISRGMSRDKIREAIIKILNIDEEGQSRLPSAGGEWIDRLLVYTQDLNDIQKVIGKFYQGHVKLPSDQKIAAPDLKQEIAKQLAVDYMESIDQTMMFIDSKANYILITTPEDLANKIGSELKVTALSDLIPRITYID